MAEEQTFKVEDLSSYDVTNYSYPSDLASDPRYGKNKVLFFINVQGGGDIATTKQSLLLNNDAVGSRYAGTRVKQAQEAKVAAGKASAALLESYKQSELANKILKATAPNKRLKSAIALYMPEALTKTYSVSWNDESDMVQSAANATAIIAIGNDFSGEKSGPTLEDAVKAQVGSAATKLLNGMKYTQKALGITPGNSKAELLFNQVDFGGMTFDYRFAPRSSDEASNVLKIIRMFRHHMLPEYFDKQNFLYIYPSEFEIRYYKEDKESEFLERHITCVLTNMTINYNPNGQFTTFENGMPTHINITLTFKELGVPTKETSPYDSAGA